MGRGCVRGVAAPDPLGSRDPVCCKVDPGTRSKTAPDHGKVEPRLPVALIFAPDAGYSRGVAAVRGIRLADQISLHLIKKKNREKKINDHLNLKIITFFVIGISENPRKII